MKVFTKENTTRVPEYKCRNCDHPMDSFSDSAASGKSPEEGDVCVCVYCSVVSVFNDKIELLPMGPEQYLKLNEEDPETMDQLTKVVKVIQSGKLYKEWNARFNP